MIRAAAFFTLSLITLGAFAAPDSATPSAPPPLPAPFPSASPPAGSMPPPLPGQVGATSVSPIPAQPTAPRPALSPPVRIPELPRPALTPVPGVPLSTTSERAISSTSSSGQFIVHGDDLKLRSAFAGRCDEVAQSVRQLLRDKQQWELPIVVLLKTGSAAKTPGPPATTTISQITNGGFHLQVTINVRGDLRPTDVRDELVRVLLAERILRHQKEIVSNRERLLPDWVYTGVIEAMDFRQRARPSTLFAAIFKSGKIYGIEEIIEASAAMIEDGLSKTIYQTSCCALVLALLDQPDGGLRMSKFLNSLASDKRSERELLNQWFPGFAATPASLNKWWSLQLASLATPTVSEPLSSAETAKQLDQALTLRFKAPPGDVPSPRHVVARHQDQTDESIPPAEAVIKKEEKTAEAAETRKPSFFERLNPFSSKGHNNDEVIEKAASEAALAETTASPVQATPEPAPLPGPASHPTALFTDRKPLLQHFLTNDKKPADTESTVPPAKPEEPAKTPDKKASKDTAKIEKPATEKPAPKSAEKTEKGEKKQAPEPAEPQPEKGSILNPLHWFRGSKKEPSKQGDAPPAESSEKKEPGKAKDKTESAVLSSAERLLWAWSPLTGKMLLMAAEANAAEPAAKPVEGFFGLKFGKKKNGAEAAAVEKPKDEKPAEVVKEKAPAEPAPKAKQKEPAKAGTSANTKPAKPEPENSETEAGPAEKGGSFLGIKFGKKKDAADQPVDAPADGGKSKTEPKADANAAKDPQKPAAKPAEVTDEPVGSAKDKPSSFLHLKGLFGGGKKPESTPETATADATGAPDKAASEKPARKPAGESSKAEPKAAKATESPNRSEGLVEAELPIEDFEMVMKRKDRVEILRRNLTALAALQTRAAVLYRPIINEYGEIIAGLVDGKTRGVPERLQSLRARSEKALTQSKAVRDLLDVYEANESPVFSGLFDDYLKLPETVDKELPPRTDPLSKYLDALDHEFSKE